MIKRNLFVRMSMLIALLGVGPGPALPETGELEWIPIPAADWLLGEDVVYLRELPSEIEAHPTLAEIQIEGISRHGYRIDTDLTGVDKIFQAQYLSPFLLVSLDSFGRDILHDQGLSTEEFVVELDGAADFIENLTGTRPTSMAYPYHMHTRELMERLRDEGWSCARDGAPHGSGGGEPTSAFLLGPHGNEAWRRSWDNLLPWEIPLSTGFTEKAVQVAESPAEMALLLYDTEAYNLLHGGDPEYVEVFTYGYPSVVDLWLAHQTWVNFYVHGNPGNSYHLGAERLAWLVDLLQSDGRFWIERVTPITEYALDRHQPSGNDPLVYEPLPPFRNERTPWNGHPCAFSFSTDDGWPINLTYADSLALRGLAMTAFVTPGLLGRSTHMTEAELLLLSQKGNVEIGTHSMSHTRLVPEAAFRLKNTGSLAIAVEVAEEQDGRHLRFYRGIPTEATEDQPVLNATHLVACYPNPFNPRLDVDLFLAGREHVSLTVHDSGGRLLRVLADDWRPGGYQSVLWDGCDQSGQELPSGIYLIRLRSGRSTDCQKALLLR